MKTFRVSCKAEPAEWAALLNLHINVYEKMECSTTELSVDDAKLIWDNFCSRTGLTTSVNIPRSLRQGNACKSYYELASGVPNEDNFQEWLKSLPEGIAVDFEKKGFEGSKNNLNYLRFILECKDISLNDFLKDKLSEEDYNDWRRLQKKENAQ